MLIHPVWYNKSETFFSASVQLLIHASPYGGATARRLRQRQPRRISIHAPLAGCDHSIDVLDVLVIKFQSTHPLRGATGMR